MTDPAGLERAMLHDPLTDDLQKEPAVESEAEPEEDLSSAQVADDVEQDPEQVPNRQQEPEPPHPETVGPDSDQGA